MLTSRKCMIFVAAGLLLLGLGASPAVAVSIFELDLAVPNAALAPFPSPYAHVSVSVPDGGGAATFTFTADTTAGTKYLLGAVSAADINTAVDVTLSDFSDAGLTRGFPQPKNVSEFGKFSATVDNADGFAGALASLSFMATPTSGVFADASSVLTPNENGFKAAGHIFVCNDASDCTAAIVTGFAGDGGGRVPEPGTLLLLGSGFLGLGTLAWRRQRRQ